MGLQTQALRASFLISQVSGRIGVGVRAGLSFIRATHASDVNITWSECGVGEGWHEGLLTLIVICIAVKKFMLAAENRNQHKPEAGSASLTLTIKHTHSHALITMRMIPAPSRQQWQHSKRLF